MVAYMPACPSGSYMRSTANIFPCSVRTSQQPCKWCSQCLKSRSTRARCDSTVTDWFYLRRACFFLCAKLKPRHRWMSQPYPGDFFSVIAVIGCRESRPCKMLRAIHFSPLPCSDLGQGVAISTTAFMLPRFFVQTPIFSVSSIVHLHLSIDECSPDAPRIRVAHDPRAPPTAVRMLC